MQKRTRPDIRHAILTARLNERPTRQMQKWARLNIRRLRGRTARHRESKVGRPTAPLATQSDNQRARIELRRQKSEDATEGGIRAEWRNHTRRRTQV